MGASTYSIEVNAPLRAVHHQWTQLEKSPRFIEGVEEVRQEGTNRPSWSEERHGVVKRRSCAREENGTRR